MLAVQSKRGHFSSSQVAILPELYYFLALVFGGFPLYLFFQVILPYLVFCDEAQTPHNTVP